MNKNPHNKKDRDYVVGLLSGRTEQRRNSEGETVTVFVPKFVNKHQPLNSIFAKSLDSMQDILIAESVHSPLVNIDRNAFRKTLKDKMLLKELKSSIKKSLMEAGFNPKKRMNVGKPLFIHWRAFN